jgi:hypothetical protein
MFEEYDVVRAKRDLSEAVRKGTEGTILIVHQAVPPAYEVEFVGQEGDSLGVLTVTVVDIESTEVGG